MQKGLFRYATLSYITILIKDQFKETLKSHKSFIKIISKIISLSKIHFKELEFHKKNW